MAKLNRTGQPVLVTTEHRGVFFGYLKGAVAKEQVTLTAARNCVYWDAGLRGFIGLATDGPGDKCRIGPAAHEQTLFGITSVTVCAPKAVEAWEAAPWQG